MATLRAILRELPDSARIDDGSDEWDASNLEDALDDGEGEAALRGWDVEYPLDDDNYAIREDGDEFVIVAFDAAGYEISPALYCGRIASDDEENDA